MVQNVGQFNSKWQQELNYQIDKFIFSLFSSFARRPIYPGRRSRFKGSSNYYHKKMNVSDEGNTSEYSVSPSSKSSTLESNPDTIRKAMKRPSEQRSYSSSDTEENVTVFFNMNKPENVI